MIWVAAAVGAIVLATIIVYNRMVALRRLTQNAWSDVDVFLRKRAELVPNLVNLVRGAAAYEASTLERLAEARARASSAPNLTVRGAVESEIGGGVLRAVMLAEANPELRANEHFLRLQEELTIAERHIADARRYYNACVRDFNTMIESFPQNLVAQMAGFRPMEFFEIDALAERNAPTVKDL